MCFVPSVLEIYTHICCTLLLQSTYHAVFCYILKPICCKLWILFVANYVGFFFFFLPSRYEELLLIWLLHYYQGHLASITLSFLWRLELIQKNNSTMMSLRKNERKVNFTAVGKFSPLTSLSRKTVFPQCWKWTVAYILHHRVELGWVEVTTLTTEWPQAVRSGLQKWTRPSQLNFLAESSWSLDL